MSETAETLFSTPAMSAVFSPEAHVRFMLRFEAALARAEAQAGIMSQEAANAIVAQCNTVFFDSAAIFAEAVLAGTPAIPLVRLLTGLVEGEAQKFVHWGATSQDAIDTALMLQMRDGLSLLLSGLLDVCACCAALAEQHRHTPMVGRTLLQQALPLPFGLKAARWLALTARQVQALRERRAHALTVQLGGAAGTLASLGKNGLRVVELLAAELNLPAPDLPWHTERDRVAEIATSVGIVAGAIAKIAGDLLLLAQTEVGEVSEGTAPGKGGSSALPHKHNPVDAMRAAASARLAIGVVPVLLSAMAQEHERAAGAWQAEWEALPNLFCYTASAVEGVRRALAGLQIDAAHMQANLALTHGLIMAESLTMALAPSLGRVPAHRIVQAACNRAIAIGEDLHQVALHDPQIRAVLSPAELDHALDPTTYMGSADAFITRALTTYHNLLSTIQ
jgi:3-carboxy-cis,cis-muconate cycloisomerase